MINETETLKKSSLITGLGEFDAELNPLKKLARKGQCFSTTVLVRELRED